jgi:hypothetical protein
MMTDEDIPMEDRYVVWIESCASELGMDICAMDVLTSEGNEYILEVCYYCFFFF